MASSNELSIDLSSRSADRSVSSQRAVEALSGSPATYRGGLSEHLVSYRWGLLQLTASRLIHERKALKSFLRLIAIMDYGGVDPRGNNIRPLYSTSISISAALESCRTPRAR